MTKLETIPAEEDASLLPHKPQSTGIRRVAVCAAVASFVIGVLAATAVRTSSVSPGRQNGAKILAKKCKAGSSTQQWQIGPM